METLKKRVLVDCLMTVIPLLSDRSGGMDMDKGLVFVIIYISIGSLLLGLFLILIKKNELGKLFLLNAILGPLLCLMITYVFVMVKKNL